MDNSKGEIKYVGFYDIFGGNHKRVSTLAATNKMDYICDVINRAGFDVHLVSPSWYDDDAYTAKFQRQNTFQISERKRITFCPSFGTRNKWPKYLKVLLTLVWLFFWLLRHVRRGEKVLVYHVQWLSLPLRWAKSIKGFKLILEVEEIYEKVWKTPRYLQIWEQKLLEAADYYITVSDVMAEILGSKVRAIIYGSYSIPELTYIPNTDGRINVIYAGSFDPIKGGAINAIRCAQYLSDKFIVNICGFGNQEIVIELKNHIDQLNAQLGRKACIYHGIKIGDDYTKLLNSCKIAINPQFAGKYMDTAFPSKVISYLSHNLRVVSTRIKSIDKSPFASLITFSETDEPESIASAIRNVQFGDAYNSKSMIKKLDAKLILDIKDLLKK